MISVLRRMALGVSTCENLFSGSLLDLLPSKIRRTGPIMRENALWFSGGATLTRVSCINWNSKEFICFPMSNLLDPFMPRHQQGLIIADIELSSMILAIVIWGSAGKGEVLLAAPGNTNAISWMTKKRAKKGIAQRLLGTFLNWIATRDLAYVGIYSRTYHNVSADALTRSSVESIGAWMRETDCKWIEMPEIWTEFCNSAKPRATDQTIPPFGLPMKLNFPPIIAEWNPSGYTASSSASLFGLSPMQTCDRHLFVE